MLSNYLAFEVYIPSIQIHIFVLNTFTSQSGTGLYPGSLSPCMEVMHAFVCHSPDVVTAANGVFLPQR